jgi:hypothetical protein
MFLLGYQNLLLALQEHYLFGKINTKKDYGFKFIPCCNCGYLSFCIIVHNKQILEFWGQVLKPIFCETSLDQIHANNPKTI